MKNLPVFDLYSPMNRLVKYRTVKAEKKKIKLLYKKNSRKPYSYETHTEKKTESNVMMILIHC